MEHIYSILIAIGAGLIVWGASTGIGKISTSGAESMARQPEVSNEIRGSMILMGALIEGVALFALVVCLLLALK